jgi:cytochrome c oxidase assembly protein subunit 15
MTDTATHPSHRRAVRAWLLLAAAMIFLTLIVGGATRLTESGLSITEWKPVTGILPPLTEAQWRSEFEKYQQIPQYRDIHSGMDLAAFKTIYWWEWSHRVLARGTGAVFLIPFLFFLWRGWIERHLLVRLWTIFGAGAALGAVGWWMVASGLSERSFVSQYRLGFHLTLACAIYAAILWTAQSLAPRRIFEVPPRIRAVAVMLMLLVLLQIYLGALVAGLHAGLIYNTWPRIDGAFVPDAARLFFDTPAWRNFFENTLTVQFDHRMLAYLIWLCAVLHALDALRLRAGIGSALTLAAVVTLQAALGIATLIHQAPLDLALSHQAFAVVALTLAVIHAQRVSPRRVAQNAAHPTLAMQAQR